MYIYEYVLLRLELDDFVNMYCFVWNLMILMFYDSRLHLSIFGLYRFYVSKIRCLELQKKGTLNVEF